MKNKGLEQGAKQKLIAEQVGGVPRAVGEFAVGERDQLRSEALAGYAVRDARIAEQEAQIKVLQSNANSWQSGYDEGRRMGGKHCMLTVDQLRAELAEWSPVMQNLGDENQQLRDECEALKFELEVAKTADHSEDVRAMVVPDGWLVEKMADNGVSGFIVRTPRAEGVRTCTAVFPDDDDPAHRLLAMLLASPPAKGGE